MNTSHTNHQQQQVPLNDSTSFHSNTNNVCMDYGQAPSVGAPVLPDINNIAFTTDLKSTNSFVATRSNAGYHPQPMESPMLFSQTQSYSKPLSQNSFASHSLQSPMSKTMSFCQNLSQNSIPCSFSQEYQYLRSAPSPMKPLYLPSPAQSFPVDNNRMNDHEMNIIEKVKIGDIEGILNNYVMNDQEKDIIEKVKIGDIEGILNNYVHPEGGKLLKDFYGNPEGCAERLNFAELFHPHSSTSKPPQDASVHDHKKHREAMNQSSKSIETHCEFGNKLDNFMKAVYAPMKKKLGEEIKPLVDLFQTMEKMEARLAIVPPAVTEWCKYGKYHELYGEGPNHETTENLDFFGPFTPNLSQNNTSLEDDMDL